MTDLMEEARKQYFELKKTYEENEELRRRIGEPIPPRPKAFLHLQSIFEPNLSDELLTENNEVPGNKNYLRRNLKWL